MNLFELKYNNNINNYNNSISNTNWKKLLLMMILIILVILITTILFINKVQAYELEKPENITYIRWNTEKRGSITIKSYYEFNSEVRGLGDKIYSYDNKEVPEDKLLGTGMNFNYYNRENARVYIAVKGDINGDGKASSTDLSVFKLVYTQQKEVDYIYEKAIDMNNDDKITATDLSQLKMMLVGMPLPVEVNPEKEDTKAPNPFEIEGTPTRTRITIKAEATDETLDIIGEEVTVEVKRFMYKLGEEGEWQEENTFTKLKTNTEYKIYAKAIDRVGNETPASNNGTIVKTDKMPEISEHLKIETSTQDPTNKNVTVKFKKDEETEGLHLEYQVGGTNREWKKGDSCEVDTNTDIYVRLVEDETGEPGEWIKTTVKNIDKVKPEIEKIEKDVTTNSITVKVEATDKATQGARDDIAGIIGYQYKIDNKGWEPQEPTLTTNHLFENLTQGTTHKVTIRAIDKAGNIGEKEIDVTLEKVPSGDENISVDIEWSVEDTELKDPETEEVEQPEPKDPEIEEVEKTEPKGSETVEEPANYTSRNENKVAKRASAEVGESKENKESKEIGERGEAPEATNKNVRIKLGTTTKYTIEYRIGENGNWKDYEEGILITENVTIYVHLKDEIGQVGTDKIIVVNNIDKVKPEPFKYTAIPTTHSITVKGKTTDTASLGAKAGVAGIKEYQVRLMDSEGNPLTEDWITLPELPAAGQEAEYTFTRAVYGITKGKTYQVSMRAIDKAGNITEANNEIKTVTVESLPKAKEHVTAELSTEEPTNKPVTVTFKRDGTVENMHIEYQIGGTDENKWLRGDTCIVEKNEIIYVRLVDEAEQTEEDWKEVKVGNIDKKEPNEFEIKAKATSNSITVWTEENVIDPAVEGAKEGITGIKGYQYRLDNGDWEPAIPTKEKTYRFPQALEQNSSHTVYMRAIDNAGNPRDMETTITTGTVEDSSINISKSYAPITLTNESVYVTFKNNSTVEGLTLKYQKNSTAEDGWMEYTTPVEMTENGTIYAKLFDSSNQSEGIISEEISNIDKEKPNPFEFDVEATTNSIIVKGQTTDKGSIGLLDEYRGIDGYQFRLMNSDGTLITDWTEPLTKVAEGEDAIHIFTYEDNGITQGENYKVSMRAVDLAGNTRKATVKGGESNEANITTDAMVDSSANIESSFSPDVATNGNVFVTLTDTSGKNYLKIKYQINSTDGEWLDYEGPVEMTDNGMVYARLFDSSGHWLGLKEIKVENIDREKPNEFRLEVTSTEDSITVSAEEEPTDIGNTGTIPTAEKYIGIRGYQFQLKDEEGNEIVGWTPDPAQPESSFTFTKETHNIEEGITYIVGMQAVDLAGNTKPASNTEAATYIGSPTIAQLVKSGNIKLGDYVDYKGGTYDGKWKVLSIDSTANTVEIVSETCVLSNTTSCILYCTGNNSSTIVSKAAQFRNATYADVARVPGSNKTTGAFIGSSPGSNKTWTSDIQAIRNVRNKRNKKFLDTALNGVLVQGDMVDFMYTNILEVQLFQEVYQRYWLISTWLEVIRTGMRLVILLIMLI